MPVPIAAWEIGAWEIAEWEIGVWEIGVWEVVLSSADTDWHGRGGLLSSNIHSAGKRSCDFRRIRFCAAFAPKH